MTSVRVRRVGEPAIPAVHVATRLIGQLGREWRVSLDEIGDELLVIQVSTGRESDRRLADEVEHAVRALFRAGTFAGWEPEFA
jgi:hypothetical protein